MSSRKRSSDNSTPAKKRRTDASSKKAGAKKNSASSSSTASQPKYAMVTSDGDKTGGTGDQSVKGIFKSLEYGPAPESQGAFNAWLDDHGRKFGHFINNEWYDAGGRGYYETTAPATGEVLAKTIQGDKDDVDYAVGCARKAHGEWSTLAPHVRARYMYAIARNVQKHARLLSVCEAVDNGKTIRESRDSDIPLVARWLYHYAGWAQLKDTEMSEWQSVGVIGGIVPWNFPLMLLVWKVAPALAMGNTVVLKPATYTRLSALMFAEICAEAGLPPGVVNVVTGGGRMGSALAEHDDVDKVAFTGSTGVGQLLRRSTAGTGKKISLELGGKSPVVVFEDADLDSVVEGVVSAIWFNQGQVCSAGSRLLVQEGVYDRLVSKIKARMKTLRVGNSLDKCTDMGPLVDQRQYDDVMHHINQAKKEGAVVHQALSESELPKRPDGSKGLWIPPTLITNINSTSTAVQEEIFGPVLVAMSFRTAKEGIALANNTRYGLGASVWTEKLNCALEVALSIKAGTVWVNGHNMFDAASGFGGYRESGFGRDGGKEGLYEYVRPIWKDRPRPQLKKAEVSRGAEEGGGGWSVKIPDFGNTVPARPVLPASVGSSTSSSSSSAAATSSSSSEGSGPVSVSASPLRFHLARPDEDSDNESSSMDGKGREIRSMVVSGGMPKIDRTPKVFYGGKQKRPDATYVRPVISPSGEFIGQVAEGNRKDVRNAVEAAHKGKTGWGKRAAHNRAQIMYYIAENLELRMEEIAGRISAMTGRDLQSGRDEVHASINRLFHWAAYADKYGGTVQETSFYGATVKVNEPVGVIGIACPEDYPLLGLVSLFAPAVVRGNVVVMIPSEKYPMSATDLYQVFETSDVPAGVVNILTGDQDHLTKYLVEHQDVDAMWYFGSAEGSRFVEYTSAGNVKRTWVNYGYKRDWMSSQQGQGEEFLLHSTECKNIWMPMGTIFAN